MRSMKKFIPLACFIVVGLFFVQPALADVPTSAWVEAELLQIQTGLNNGQSDTRLLCTAVNGAFSNTWLIVYPDAAKMVAAGALTAFSLGYNVWIYIVPYGTGYRVEKLRVVMP